ncbi:MEGF6-like protein [Mya arenaria]|uniref:MEGF6-like protein n=1 Tax=Mya arenaria TaxID=6604 RepID=A0ABY7DNA7_MYAAR|nr:MEGF6-like protein [Mya arenaria]
MKCLLWHDKHCNQDYEETLNITGAATQSSNYLGCTADKALNGLEDQGSDDAELCQACSVTNAANPWWALDLGGEHLIGRIQVIGRPDHMSQSSGLQVSMSISPSNNDVIVLSNNNEIGLNQQLNPPRLARYIKITSVSGTSNMVLCEVKLFESECNNGMYGYNCTGKCGHCKDVFPQCDRINGTCLQGCETGYATPPRCLQTCNNSFYGENCAQRCGNCLDGRRCDFKNGSCPRGCSSGYRGVYCNQTCPAGMYGNSCQRNCSGNCFNGLSCHFSTGICSYGCTAGFNYSIDTSCGTEYG